MPANRLGFILHPPDERPRIQSWNGPGMSNFDLQIDAGMKSELLTGKVSYHAAWDHYGVVWMGDDGHFYETVSCYGTAVATFAADDLESLMNAVNDEYGSK